MKYVTVPRVPLCKIGAWGASTGQVHITDEVLSSLMESEKEIGRAVVKIGHRDPRKNNPTFDGDPVYGQVANLKAEGDVLYGDLVNVPAELAESMKSAYPNRSVEIAWDVKLRDAAGKVRKTLKAALIGLALLGATPPAVKGLSALSASIGDAVVSSLSSLSETPEVEHVQEALRDAAMGLYVDKREDAELLELDTDSIVFKTPVGTYKAEYTIDEDGVYVFGDTTPVIRDFPQPILPITDAEVVSTDGNTADNSNSERSEATMDFLSKLRAKYGLPDTATEDEIFAAVNAAPVVSAASEGEGTKPETVMVSKAVLDSLQTNFAETQTKLADLQKKAEAKERDDIMVTFLSEGRVHVSERDYWRKQLDTDQEGTVAFLSARTPVLPVHEVGSDSAGNLNPAELSEDAFKSAAVAFGLPFDVE